MNLDYKNTKIIFDNFNVEYYKNAYFIIDYKVDKLYNLSQKIDRRRQLIMKSGEKAKSFKGVTNILDFFCSNDVDRSSEIVAIGGGSLLDLVGFTTSIYKRGIPLHFIPTTLLSMADASIGGKNGINYRKIKNIIGTYKFPETIFIDTNFTKTLPRKDIISGYIEILKMSMLDSFNFFNFLISNPFNTIINNHLDKIIQKSIQIKQNFIDGDIFDENKRKFLNFGHTIGHSIELEYNLPHGIAVAYGIHYELKFSEHYKSLNYYIRNIYDAHLKEIGNFFKIEIEINRIIDKIKHDKKNTNSQIDLILLEDIGKPVIFKISYAKFINDLQNMFKS